jgi:hypothetical protein
MPLKAETEKNSCNRHFSASRIKTLVDSTKAKIDLNFKLTAPVEEGIRRTLEGFGKTYVKVSSFQIRLDFMAFSSLPVTFESSTLSEM